MTFSRGEEGLVLIVRPIGEVSLVRHQCVSEEVLSWLEVLLASAPFMLFSMAAGGTNDLVPCGR